MRKSLFLLIAALTLFAIGCSGSEEKTPPATGSTPGGDMNSMKHDDPTAGDTDKVKVATAGFGNFCMPCHSAENKKDDVDLASMKTAADIKAHTADLLKVLESKKMPPANAAKQPTDAERAALVEAIKGL